jgi:hypothetical protein
MRQVALTTRPDKRVTKDVVKVLHAYLCSQAVDPDKDETEEKVSGDIEGGGLEGEQDGGDGGVGP